MVNRDEYYNPDTEDQGITELITCKHRNGPVGTVKLLFEPQFTRFRNLAAQSRMRHGTIAIAICFFLMPTGEIYGYNKVKATDGYQGT